MQNYEHSEPDYIGIICLFSSNLQTGRPLSFYKKADPVPDVMEIYSNKLDLVSITRYSSKINPLDTIQLHIHWHSCLDLNNLLDNEFPRNLVLVASCAFSFWSALASDSSQNKFQDSYYLSRFRSFSKHSISYIPRYVSMLSYRSSSLLICLPARKLHWQSPNHSHQLFQIFWMNCPAIVRPFCLLISVIPALTFSHFHKISKLFCSIWQCINLIWFENILCI